MLLARSAPEGEADVIAMNPDIDTRRSAVGGKADVPATWPGSPLLAITGHPAAQLCYRLRCLGGTIWEIPVYTVQCTRLTARKVPCATVGISCSQSILSRLALANADGCLRDVVNGENVFLFERNTNSC